VIRRIVEMRRTFTPMAMAASRPVNIIFRGLASISIMIKHGKHSSKRDKLLLLAMERSPISQ